MAHPKLVARQHRNAYGISHVTLHAFLFGRQSVLESQPDNVAIPAQSVSIRYFFIWQEFSCGIMEMAQLAQIFLGSDSVVRAFLFDSEPAINDVSACMPMQGRQELVCPLQYRCTKNVSLSPEIHRPTQQQYSVLGFPCVCQSGR